MTKEQKTGRVTGSETSASGMDVTVIFIPFEITRLSVSFLSGRHCTCYKNSDDFNNSVNFFVSGILGLSVSVWCSSSPMSL